MVSFLYLKDGTKAKEHLLNYIRERDKIITYIKNQKQHHQSENFHAEFKRLVEEHTTSNSMKNTYFNPAQNA
jgi:hypothetical protein